jgi:hypothetical protein
VRALDELEPEVVHFCGHADRRGRITLAGQNGSEHYMSPREMAGLFEGLARRPRLSVFATCFSYETAVAVGVHGCHAIGFEGEIYDDTASSFSALFYERLASRRELEVARAFKLARIATIASGQPDAERARLLPEPLNAETC